MICGTVWLASQHLAKDALGLSPQNLSPPSQLPRYEAAVREAAVLTISRYADRDRREIRKARRWTESALG